jgi:hypothetical protein
MALSQDQVRDNPWWSDPAAVGTDPLLRRLEERPVAFFHPIPFELDIDAAYTLRGPRQVGKSTLLKRLVKHLIVDRRVPTRQIMYFDVEGGGIRTAHELQSSVAEYISFARSATPSGRLYVLLDEVTGVPAWGSAIRVLHGRGDLEGVTSIATGSHARDLRRGGERAPGRHGEVEYWDWVMMPLCFRDYIGMHAPQTAGALPAIDLFDPITAHEAAVEISLHGAIIESLFERYLRTGGYPHAIGEETANGIIPERVFRLYLQAFTGEMIRAGRREEYFRETVAWAAHHRLGREFNWSSLSGETAIGTGNTAREYLEDAEAAFVWHIYQRVKTPEAPAPAPRSPKKLYPVDPFTWHVLASWISGSRDAWGDTLKRVSDPAQRGDLVESIVADHLRRWLGRFSLYYRAPTTKEEIDFVLFEGSRRGLVEVKQKRQLKNRDWKALVKNGGGILASVDQLRLMDRNRVAIIPVSHLLAGLAAPLTLFPSRD